MSPTGIAVPVRRGEIWRTDTGRLVVAAQVDDLTALATVVCVAVTRRPQAAPEPLRIRLGAPPGVAWVKTNVVMTLPRDALVERVGRLGSATMDQVGAAMARVLGCGCRSSGAAPGHG